MPDVAWNDRPLKVVVTVAEMARMVGLSRARFYQLQREGVFPPPAYSLATRRPVYVEEQQAAILEARRRNLGVNGRPVLFYARGPSPGRPSKPPRKPQDERTALGRHPTILNAVRGLGLNGTSAGEVDAVVSRLYPAGTARVAEEDVIRAVFLHLSRPNTGDNVRR